MNNLLLEQIIKHVYSNFMIIPSNFVNINSKIFMSQEFLLSQKMSFEFDGEEIKNNLWGCQSSSDEKDLKLLLADCSQDKTIKEYCLLVALQDSPSYGVYLVCNNEVDSEPLIAFTLDGTAWLPCNTYLQATFLAGMEQMKEVGLKWNQCKEYDDEYKMIISFINFHSKTYEVEL